MDVLPNDVAEKMKDCAWAAAWHAANTRMGSEGDAQADKVHFHDNADEFKQKATGILTEEVCDHIKWMFWNAAWYTANTRRGYDDDATKDKENMEAGYRAILASREISETLAENIRGMSWFASWYCANTRKGYNDDARGDEAKANSYFRKISGEVRLVSMNFDMDTAHVLGQRPLALPEQTLINNGDITQMIEFSFAVTEGTTRSLSTTVGFEYSITQGLEVGFEGFGSASLQASFTLSASTTLEQSMQQGTTRTYTFPLSVPAKSTYTAKALIQEAQMDVGYDMVLDIGGYQKTIRGTWTGAAVSRASYEVTPN